MSTGRQPETALPAGGAESRCLVELVVDAGDQRSGQADGHDHRQTAGNQLDRSVARSRARFRAVDLVASFRTQQTPPSLLAP